jgi:hypothetical protein
MRRPEWAVLFFLAGPGCDATPPPATPAPPVVSVAPKDEPAPVADVSARRQCHEGVGALLASFGAPVEVVVWVSRSDAKLAEAAAALEELLAAVKNVAGDRLTYRTIDVRSDEIVAAAKKAGLQEVLVEGAAGLQLAFFGVTLRYRGENDVIPVVATESMAGMPFWIAGKLRAIRNRADHIEERVGVVTGKDELRLDEASMVPASGSGRGPSLNSTIEEALTFYRLVDVELTSAVDPELQGLLVTQPRSDYSDDELRRLDAYVMGGRPLMVVAGAVNMKPFEPSMQATLDTHGLERLLAGYGIELRATTLHDDDVGLKLPVSTDHGSTVVHSAPGVLVLGPGLLDTTFPPFFRLERLAFPFPSPLALHPARQPEARLRVVARSSDASFARAGSPLDMRAAPEGEPLDAEQPIAVAIEGRLRSAFGDATSAGPARVIVIASPQFLTNPFARAGNPPPLPPQMQMMDGMLADKVLRAVALAYAQKHLTPTILAFKNLLDWMAGDERLVACSALLVPLAAADRGKCTKEDLAKLVDAGLSVDEAIQICGKKK